ncbi:MAG: hypothetical protein IPH07_37110 [Deltaproteobacteria bacterium]|nr:hypothetical protein [Deltaproteobacteria bacterium]MBK8713445.1 hypothetical protein [Deltaproteobacteria bacterium]MBP7288070.1 hypothetical protein [Nannocystaceae bacterium]
MTAVRTFGFDVVLQLDEALTSRLLAARTYDLARIPGGHSPLDVLSVGTAEAPSYVECGMPRVFAVAGDPADVVHIELPFIASAGLPNLGNLSAACELGDVHLRAKQGDIDIDLTTVDAADIALHVIEVSPAADGLGATATPGLFDLPGDLAERKAAIAAAARTNSQRLPLPPVDIDGVARSSILAPFPSTAEAAGNRVCGGVTVGLYAGVAPSQAIGSAIPQSPSSDPYNFALVIASDVLGGLIDRLVHDRLTPSVSPWVLIAPQTVAMPGGAVTITPPDASGRVGVAVAFGAADQGRELVVSHRGDRHTATLDAVGAANVSLVGAIGDPVTITIDGLMKKVAASRVLVRPGARPYCTPEGIRLQFEGEIRYVDAHTTDSLRFDVLLPLGIDRSQQARLAVGTPKLIEIDADPGLEFLAWFIGEGFFSTLGAALLEGLYSQILTAMINRFGDLGGLVADLDLPELPEIAGIAMFFEELRTSRDGLLVSGHADAGIYHAAGRRRVTLGATQEFVVSGGGVYHVADWTPAGDGAIELSFRGPHRAFAEGAAELFWRRGYDECVQASYEHTIATIPPGGTVAFVIEGARDLTKVLVERGVGEEADALTFSWIAWVKRARRGVTLRSSVQREVVATVRHAIFTVKEYAYSGLVDHEASRITLTADTLAGAPATGYAERWFWDGHPLEDGVTHEFAGGSVQLFAAQRRLSFRVDPRTGDPTRMALAHEVRFTGVDALLRPFDDTVLIPTPVFRYMPQGLADSGRWRDRPLDDPRRDLDFRDIPDPRVRLAAARARLEALVGRMEDLVARNAPPDGPEINAAVARALRIAGAAGLLAPARETRVEPREVSTVRRRAPT